MSSKDSGRTQVFLGSDTDPTEEYLHHRAGLDGRGGSSYIDEVVLRMRDTAGDGVLDETNWYLQNRHHDVVALIDDSGWQLEMVRYSAYGVPFGMPAGDADSDGDCDDGDTVDTDQIQTWIANSQYDVRGDIDLDGDVDSTDKNNALTGVALGREALSNAGNSIGMAGRPWDLGGYNIRHRRLDAELGRWTRRDPLGYVDGGNLYAYAQNAPSMWFDPLGAECFREVGRTREYRDAFGAVSGTVTIKSSIVRSQCECRFDGPPSIESDFPGIPPFTPSQLYNCFMLTWTDGFEPCLMESSTHYEGPPPCESCEMGTRDVVFICTSTIKIKRIFPPAPPPFSELPALVFGDSMRLCTGCPVCNDDYPDTPETETNPCDHSIFP